MPDSRLVDLLQHPDTTKRKAAIQALARAKDPAAIEHLEQVMFYDEDESVGELAQKAITYIQRNSVAPVAPVAVSKPITPERQTQTQTFNAIASSSSSASIFGAAKEKPARDDYYDNRDDKSDAGFFGALGDFMIYGLVITIVTTVSAFLSLEVYLPATSDAEMFTPFIVGVDLNLTDYLACDCNPTLGISNAVAIGFLIAIAHSFVFFLYLLSVHNSSRRLFGGNGNGYELAQRVSTLAMIVTTGYYLITNVMVALMSHSDPATIPIIFVLALPMYAGLFVYTVRALAKRLAKTYHFVQAEAIAAALLSFLQIALIVGWFWYRVHGQKS